MSHIYNDNNPQAGKDPATDHPNTAGQNAGGPNTGSPANSADLGRQVGDSVRHVLQTGDLSALGTAAGAVGQAVKTTAQSVSTAFQQASAKPPARQPQQPPNAGAGYQPQRYQANASANRPVWYGYGVNNRPVPANQKPRNNAGVGQMVVGGIGAFGFGLFSLAGLDLFGFGAGALTAMGLFGIPFVACVLVVAFGSAKHGLAKRLIAYSEKLANKNVMSYAELGASCGREPKQVAKDMRKGIQKGMMRYIWLDEQKGNVIFGENAWHLYQKQENQRRQEAAQEAERQQRIAQNPAYAELEAFKQEGNTTLQRIREANDDIPGEEISAKLEELEGTTSKIFSYIEQYPQKLPDTRRFMNYYLPTTLKLVGKYHEYEIMEVRTPSITKAMQEIESSLDTINKAFESMLDSLFHDDTLDVSTDIEVLQSMLQQEGWTGADFKMDAETQPGTTLRF